MYCGNCGAKIDDDAKFCPACGAKINESFQDENLKTEIKTPKISEEDFTTQLEAKGEEIQKKVKEKTIETKQFFIKNKKIFLSGFAVIIVIIIGITLFNTFYDFTKIKWKEDGDYITQYTSSKKIELNVECVDKEGNSIDNIEFYADAGETIPDGTNVIWKLPSKEGIYTITAKAPSGKKITKKIEVINFQENVLLGMNVEEVDEKTVDSDGDGIIDVEEKERGLDPYLADSDMDGLLDSYEINVSKTDPLKEDTDGDELLDGDEITLGLNPLEKSSKNDGINDSKRTLNYTLENNNVKAEITGKGNIASSNIDIFENKAFLDINGMTSKVYDFSTNGAIDKALVEIKYDLDEIKELGLNENNLTLYYFNEDTKKFEEVKTIVDKNNQKLKVELNHFSKYVIGDKSKVALQYNIQVLFAIDNSRSMYTNSQLAAKGESTLENYVPADPNFKRLSLTENLINMLNDDYKFSIAEFSGTNVNIHNFSNNKDSLYNAIESMRSNWNSDLTGTNIVAALTEGIEEFKNDSNLHYLVLLTDGDDTTYSLSSKANSIIKRANELNVKIIIVGLGNNISKADLLRKIAEGTEGDYIEATSASALEEIYNILISRINFNYIDTDNDGEIDGIIYADSGFVPSIDGFNFANYGSTYSPGGNCYGMATFAMLYYQNKLPVKKSENTVKAFAHGTNKSNGYDLNYSYFSKNKNLYGYVPKNEKLYNFLYNRTVRDKIVDGTWMFRDDIYKSIENICKISVTKYNKNDRDFTSYQSAILDMDSVAFKNIYNNSEDRELLNAIWYLYILQYDDESTSFSADPDRAFLELNENLNNGIPCVLTVHDGDHAINAIRLIRSINDENSFILQVYDNNYPGEIKNILIERSKYSKLALDFTAWTNEYCYKCYYDIYDNGNLKENKTRVDICYPQI